MIRTTTLCGACLNMARNAAFPPKITWKVLGEKKEQYVVGSDEMSRVILRADEEAVTEVTVNFGTFTTNPFAVTVVRGTAVCGVHADIHNWGEWR